ncbi:hypothetical protein N7509_006170 [Penicillium cosmopolitanum]|uniref:Uncharacterized protein n=1 Tax=Penicillium cosmopolitanum TaxID=1131564 RepID=A0A9X0BAR9_9EURO|nr:uncharacterized protein N7509_006170 [Penicillium cosmopolitanum]KAJ5398057.1 hypothetical protein N7509_006170 [Penicillium cosmopolitanum]
MASDDNLYEYYKPNKIVAIVFAAIFLATSVIHTWKIFTTRQWFGIAILLGGLFEFVGLLARAYGHDHLDKLPPYIVQMVLILLAPILYAAGVYMFFGRLVVASGHPKLSLIRVNWETKIFVTGDILCFLVQAFGAVSLANLVNSHDSDTAHKVDVAKNVILAGLALQVILFLVFLVSSVIFHIRVSKRHIAKSVDPTLRLQLMIYSIYATGVLITGRNIYRLIEYKSGNGGYLQENEWPQYGLDVGLMAIYMVITFFWYFADTKARANNPGKYGRVPEDQAAWSGNINDDSFPLNHPNAYESGYANGPHLPPPQVAAYNNTAYNPAYDHNNPGYSHA